MCLSYITSCSHYASNTYTAHELSHNRALSTSLFPVLAPLPQCWTAINNSPLHKLLPLYYPHSGIHVLDASSAPAHAHLRTTTPCKGKR